MKRWVRSFKVTVPALIFFALFSNGLHAGPLVSWASQEGINRLFHSTHKLGFFLLANNFQAQSDRMTCAPTTGAIVMNALEANTERAPYFPFDSRYLKYLPKGFDPKVRRYTPDTFMSPATEGIKTKAQLYGAPVNGAPNYGLELRQLHQMFLAHSVHSVLRIVDAPLSDSDAKTEMIKALDDKGTYLVVNYSRKTLNQPGGGHVSPVGAYDETSDSFLVLDVNSATAAWTWVEAKDLIAAMRTRDGAENRGYLIISE